VYSCVYRVSSVFLRWEYSKERPLVAIALTTTASDCGDWAEIQAGAKTIPAMPVHGACAIAALMAQGHHAHEASRDV